MFVGYAVFETSIAIRPKHGVILVGDMARSIEFYQRTMNLKVATRSPSDDGRLDFVCLCSSHYCVELVAIRSADAGHDPQRLAASVLLTKTLYFETAALVELHERLAYLGVGGLTDIRQDHPHFRSFRFTDPDGTVIQVASPQEGNDFVDAAHYSP